MHAHYYQHPPVPALAHWMADCLLYLLMLLSWWRARTTFCCIQ